MSRNLLQTPNLAALPTVESGQAACIEGARIAGVVSCVPRARIGNEQFVDSFGVDKVAEVTKMTGVEVRYWVAPGETTSDLCVAASERLLEGAEWDRQSLDAVIFVSQTPDYRLPATAALIQARLQLRPNIIAFDVSLGCSGYVYGLWLAMTIVASGAAQRVLLAVGDTSSQLVDPQDRATAMLFGDAGTATIVEASPGSAPAYFILGSDGRGADNLIVPAGAFREAKHRSPNNPEKLYMDGGEIFTFTLRAVPKLIAETAQLANRSMDEFEGFLLHQANRFMINHLAKKAKLPPEKVFSNIDRFGNTSSATVPLLMTDTLGSRLRQETLLLGLFGFGVGYSWASAAVEVGPLACVETITNDV